MTIEKQQVTEKSFLKSIILQALKENPSTQFSSVIRDVEKICNSNTVFPSEEESSHRNLPYGIYQRGGKICVDEELIRHIIWDLIVDRAVTVGADRHNEKWPWLCLTEYGEKVADQTLPTHHQQDRYIEFLKAEIPDLDETILQYVQEGLGAYQRLLCFAAAVMYGAAAEKALLLLLGSIGDALTDPGEKQKVQNLLEGGRLPKVFNEVRDRISALITEKKIPYSVHQGCLDHLLSMFEMVRVQRNEAVHPKAGEVSKDKVFLTQQTLPTALSSTYRLIGWFKQNDI